MKIETKTAKFQPMECPKEADESMSIASTVPQQVLEKDLDNLPVYWGDRWGFMIWLIGATILVFLHFTQHLAFLLR